MKPVRPGDQGPAVEDIQRRLRTLGYDLRGGIDGIFASSTAEAVRSFQRDNRLAEDGIVGDETWSALVDETFHLGDRMLYLRLPHFHGRDVRTLQHALNVLGFACGKADGILGNFSERALRDFQRNSGLPADGIMGPDTARALVALSHVWETKDPRAHSAATLLPARKAEVLARLEVGIGGLDDIGARIASRVANLALATTDRSRVIVLSDPSGLDRGGLLKVLVCGSGTALAMMGRPVVRLEAEEVLVPRLVTAVSAARAGCEQVVVEAGLAEASDERDEQRAAVALLDALCVVFD